MTRDTPSAETPRLRPERRDAAGREIASLASVQLPADLLEASVRRLGTVALIYASVFFLAGPFPNLLCQGVALVDPAAVCQPDYFTSLRMLAPPVLSIFGGLGLFVLVRRSGLPSSTLLRCGLAFEILASYGIALSEYQGVVSPLRYAGMEPVPDAGGFGLSWVAVWVMLFAVVVPTSPRRTLWAAVLSVSAVPVSFGLYTALGINTVPLGPIEFFFALVFPYILVAVMAWLASRIVYGLGREIRRAREVGSYRLVERLGIGGMGEVWRAEHRLLARPAAVKLIRSEALGENDPGQRRISLERFEREAQATAALRSPHTVGLYDFGVADDGTFFYVMELLEGYDLEALVRRFGPLPPERAVHLLRQACHSLGEAHQAGLVHRDVKPSNLYACRLGRESDWVKVLDFGMVKRRSESGERDPKLTAEHALGGTPAWMAPEQAVGGPLDGRSDLYALGCVGYWLLTGAAVFEGTTAVEVLTRHVRDEPEPPGTRTELAIPPELDAAILSCLAKRPGDRPASADALDAALARVPLATPWTPERATEWWDLHGPGREPGIEAPA